MKAAMFPPKQTFPALLLPMIIVVSEAAPVEMLTVAVSSCPEFKFNVKALKLDAPKALMLTKYEFPADNDSVVEVVVPPSLKESNPVVAAPITAWFPTVPVLKGLHDAPPVMDRGRQMKATVTFPPDGTETGENVARGPAPLFVVAG